MAAVVVQWLNKQQEKIAMTQRNDTNSSREQVLKVRKMMINFEKAAWGLSIICASIGGALLFVHFYSVDTLFTSLPLLIIFAFMFMVSRSIKMQRAAGFGRFKNEFDPLSSTDYNNGGGSYADSTLDINPASGLSMISGTGGVDVGGNSFGSNSSSSISSGSDHMGGF